MRKRACGSWNSTVTPGAAWRWPVVEGTSTLRGAVHGIADSARRPRPPLSSPDVLWVLVGRESAHLAFVPCGPHSAALTEWPRVGSTVRLMLRVSRRDRADNWNRAQPWVLVDDTVTTLRNYARQAKTPGRGRCSPYASRRTCIRTGRMALLGRYRRSRRRFRAALRRRADGRTRPGVHAVALGGLSSCLRERQR